VLVWVAIAIAFTLWPRYAGVWPLPLGHLFGSIDENSSVTTTIVIAGWPEWIIPGYAGLCLLEVLWVAVRWATFRKPRPVEAVRHWVRQPADPPRHHVLNGDAKAFDRFLLSLAGNESLRLEVTQIAVELPGLPPALDRLRLVQLSDLHLSGRVPFAYFHYVVEVVNRLRPDFVFLTGDIVEKEQCLPWAKELFAQLQPRLGTYFVLGNHELRLEVTRVRQTLEDAGLIHLGGRVVEVRADGVAAQASADLGESLLRPGGEAGLFAVAEKFCNLPPETAWAGTGTPGNLSAPRLWPGEPMPAGRSSRSKQPAKIFLAGNERPWLGEAPSLTQVAGWDAPHTIRIGLAHTPDQIRWARKESIDLLLAGHLHGGQIRLPGIGPIVSPSRYGIRYNAGLFYLPPTLLYVNRGLSARLPLRWNCRPEIACLTLYCGKTASGPELGRNRMTLYPRGSERLS
jgi:predicted MPP superfamily phosphohydrolase